MTSLSSCGLPVVIYAVTSEHRVGQCFPMLNSHERKRAELFRFRQDRDRFVIRRGLLRLFLSRIINETAATIEIAEGVHGKPFLLQHPNLHFNLAHSKELICFAFAKGKRVGVDVEIKQSIPDPGGMGRIIFCPEDVEWIEKQACSESAFFKIWARSEAYVKAIGTGFQQRLTQQLQSSTDSCVVQDSEDSTWWKITDVEVASGYEAAVATEVHAPSQLPERDYCVLR